MPDARSSTAVADIAEVCAALADPTRLRILALLADGEVCVCHIHGSLDIPQPTASRHLAYLRRTGLVQTRRAGLWVHYRVAEDLAPQVRHALDAVLHAVRHCPEPAVDGKQLARTTGRAVPTLVSRIAGCCAAPLPSASRRSRLERSTT
jgi:ArsR family transcriptional regulator